MGNIYDRQMSDVSIAMLESRVKELQKQTTDTASFLDLFYPVGSYYETSNGDFNPNNEWGGVWEKELEGQVHVSSGSNYTISGAIADDGRGTSDGGATSVTLTSAQSGLPSHGHTLNPPTVGYGGDAELSWEGTSITSGQHQHGVGYASNAQGGGNTRNGPYGAGGVNAEGSVNTYGETTNNVAGHTHTIPGHTHNLNAHTHTLSGGSVGDATTQNAAESHTNMQPYIVVHRWHRTA